MTPTTLPTPSRAHDDMGAARPVTRPIPGPIAPALIQTAQFLRSIDGFLESNWSSHGDVFRASILGFATGKVVFVADPDHIEAIFKLSPSKARAGDAARKSVEPVAGVNSLLSLDGPRHLDHRRILLPRFHGDRLALYTDIMREEVDRAFDAVPYDQPFAMRDVMAELTLEVIMRAVFGLRHGKRYEDLREALVAMMDNDLAFNLALMVPVLRRELGPWKAWGRFQDVRAAAYGMLRAEVQERRLAPDVDERTDILSMLIQGRAKDGSGLSDDELLDELMTLLVAGHETTATALAWTFELLHRHPHVTHRLVTELRAGDEAYLDAVVHEVLRLRPVVPFVARVLHEPLELGEFVLEPGVTVCPCVHLVHRRPDLYPRPESFEPERFLDLRPSTYEWIPFGGGTRRCLGASFAPLEMKVVIRRVLETATLEPAGPRPERIRRRTVFFVPEHGTQTVRTREPRT
jgi:cytochrome P450